MTKTNPERFLAGIVAGAAILIAIVVLGTRLTNATTTPTGGGRIAYVAPTPTPIDVLWVDTAGNLGLRGVEAVIPGKPDEKTSAKLSEACRASAERNGEGTLTICMVKDVGAVVKAELYNKK